MNLQPQADPTYPLSALASALPSGEALLVDPELRLFEVIRLALDMAIDSRGHFGAELNQLILARACCHHLKREHEARCLQELQTSPEPRP